MLTVAVLIASIIGVTTAALCIDKMLDVVKIAERKGPTVAAIGFCIRLAVVSGIIGGLIWAWSSSY